MRNHGRVYRQLLSHHQQRRIKVAKSADRSAKGFTCRAATAVYTLLIGTLILYYTAAIKSIDKWRVRPIQENLYYRQV